MAYSDPSTKTSQQPDILYTFFKFVYNNFV